MSRKVLVRADASLQFGSGHVMRCLSLAQTLRERGGEVHFACRDLPGHLFDAIRAQDFELHVLPAPSKPPTPRSDIPHAAWLAVDEAQDVEETCQILDRIGGCDTLLVDHYALDARWQRSVASIVARIAVIDDLADRDHAADLLLDQNLSFEDDRYAARVPVGCGRMLGPTYALLRKEFVVARQRMTARSGELCRVLVFLGGVDAAQYTEAAVEALALLPTTPAVEVLVGAGNPRHEAIAARCAALGFDFARDVKDMAERMARADLSIGAGGSATWERACLGLPSVILIAADNQRPGASAMQQAGCALALEAAQATPQALSSVLQQLQTAPERLREMATRNAQLVDGRGAARVARNLLPPEVSLRRVNESDRDSLFEWRNHPEVRRQSHSRAAIERAGHDQWFSARLGDTRTALLIAECADQPAGVLRYDHLDGGEALVSIYLVPGQGGKGLGAEILRAGTRWLGANGFGAKCIRAEVGVDNHASQRAFREAGYVGGPTLFNLALAKLER